MKSTKLIMSANAIGKRYPLGFIRRNDTLRDKLVQIAKALTHNNNDRSRKIQLDKNEFWALRNISFDVHQGDVLGIIGPNGAGKSTLLKILSRITEPTEGEVKILGQVASLLEVGTGFHPELSGKENIFMNGSILGMSREDIKKKFDEIVAFSGIAKFINTPVKRYSSGMYVRLAFSVAAHLEPDILIVDEVLAVGDAEFQKKCLGKMQDVSQSGKTILFVSHNMSAIKMLVQKCMLIDNGRIRFLGDTNKCINEYMNLNIIDSNSAEMSFPKRRPDRNKPIAVQGIRFVSKDGTITNEFNMGSQWNMDINLAFAFPNMKFEMVVAIFNQFGIKVLHLLMIDSLKHPFVSKKDDYAVRVTLDKLKLTPGKYYTNIWIASAGISPKKIDFLEKIINFKVNQGTMEALQYENSEVKIISRDFQKSNAVFYVPSRWKIL